VRWLQTRDARPFFLYVPFTSPHSPLQGPDDGPVKGAWERGSRATYVRMVERMDEQVGRILAQLDRMKAVNNTIVIFKSDNGGYGLSNNTPLRGRKGTTWEGGIRIPCMIRWPGTIPAGTTTGQTALSMDLTATIAASAGVTPPRPFDGMDLTPVLAGRQKPAVRTVFWRYKRLQARRWAVREGDWKYVRDGETEALHDLATDEREERNLIAGQEAKANRMRQLLSSWEKEVEAPRLRDFR
jgi:arylsulfatase A-like enzyme